jgi:hypothetical protein
MSQIPESPWRPARWLTTEFVQPTNIAVVEAAAPYKDLPDDERIKGLCDLVRDAFIYPLDKNGDPSAGLLLRRYDKGNIIKSYFFNEVMDYAWGFPNETLKIRKGICIDTALLLTSLLLAAGIPAKCCLGAIKNAVDGSVAGYHAWTEMVYRGLQSSDETTIHSKGAETIISIGGTYNRNSDWAKVSGIYYSLEARFDNTGYEAIGELGKNMVCLMGLPPAMVQCYGMQATLEKLDNKRRLMAKEWRKSEVIKHAMLELAYV